MYHIHLMNLFKNFLKVVVDIIGQSTIALGWSLFLKETQSDCLHCVSLSHRRLRQSSDWKWKYTQSPAKLPVKAICWSPLDTWKYRLEKENPIVTNTCCEYLFYCQALYSRGHFYLHGLTLIPAWISNYIHYKVWDEITYPFLNFNGCTVEV